MSVRLIGIARDPAASKIAEFALDECFSAGERHKALPKTDVLVLCVRLAFETRGLVDASPIAALPQYALLGTAARGGLIDYGALYHTLSNGHLGGAGIDVYWTEPFPPDDPLLKFLNVIATPPVAAVTDRSYADIADVEASNIERLRRAEPPLNRAA